MKKSFKDVPFYETLIEKPYIKLLNDIDMLRELPFYDKLSIVKTLKEVKGYARNYDVEIIDSRESSIQLTISRPSIKEFFNDLLAGIKGKYKGNAERKFASVYFNSATKTLINYEDNIDKSFQEIFQ